MDARRRWTLIGWAAAAAALAAVLVVAIRAPRPAPLPTVPRQGPVAPSGPALRKAYDFRLRSFSGPLTSLSDFRGEFIVFNFWASWCVPCREEMPNLERTWRNLRNRGVVVLGINVSDDYDDAAAFLKQLRITYPNVYDPEQTRLNQYQVTGLPTTFFIDTQLRIRGRVAGGYLGDQGYQQLRGQILQFLLALP